MLFYQLTVSPKGPHLPGETSEAKVMVRLDSDVETETAEAVRYLEQHGWEVTGVRHAQIADAAEEFVQDDKLLDLYARASRDGIACLIPASEAVERAEF